MVWIKTMVVLLAGLVWAAGTAVGLQDVPGPHDNNDWPLGSDPRDAFDYVPPDDFVLTVGVTAVTPDSLVIAGLGMTFQIDPFFTDSQTEITMLPAFAANHSLETGLDFNGWSASVDVNLSLAPWALTSTGGWLELHPAEWIVFTAPRVAVAGGVGWGPKWAPVGGWSHALGGFLDAQADWSLPTLWNSPLDLTVESNLDATWTFPEGGLVTDWLATANARSILPLFRTSPAALRAGVTAQVFLLPTFGFGFDVRLEFRANSFYAYGLVGAGAAGIRAEAGVEMTIGVKMFNWYSQESEEE